MFTNSTRTSASQACDSRLTSIGMKSGAILGALSLTMFGAVALAAPASAGENDSSRGSDSHSSDSHESSNGGSDSHESSNGGSDSHESSNGGSHESSNSDSHGSESHSSDGGSESHSSDGGSESHSSEGGSDSHSSEGGSPEAPHSDGGSSDSHDGGSSDSHDGGSSDDSTPGGPETHDGTPEGPGTPGGGSDDNGSSDDDTVTVTAETPLSKVICDDGDTLTLSVVGHGTATYEQEEGESASGLAGATKKAQAKADKDAAKRLKAKQALHPGSTAGACVVVPPVDPDAPVDTTTGPISQSPTEAIALTNLAAAATTTPTSVNIPAAATTAGSNPTSVSVPRAATIPTAVPSGDGSSAPGSDFPVWGIAMMVAAALVAAGAGTKALASNNR